MFPLLIVPQKQRYWGKKNLDDAGYQKDYDEDWSFVYKKWDEYIN